MIRPFTCVCMLLAGASGLYLYHVKHRTHMLEDRIADLVRATAQTHQRIEMLRAEWALLNRPERLRDLAAQYLSLQPLKPAQFVRMADLDQHLPPPELPGPKPVVEPPAGIPMAQAAPPVVGLPAAAGDATNSADTHQAPVRTANDGPGTTPPAAAPSPPPVVAAQTAPARPVVVATHTAPRTEHSPRHETVTAAHRPTRVLAPVIDAFATSPAGAREIRRPLVQRAEALAMVPRAYAAPPVGSSLGMAATTRLPAPVPMQVSVVRGSAHSPGLP